MKTGTKRRHIHVRFDDDMADQIDVQAKKAKRDRSDFVRFVVETAIEKAVKEETQEVGK